MQLIRSEKTERTIIYRILSKNIIPSLLKDVIPISAAMFYDVNGEACKCDTFIGRIDEHIVNVEEKELFFVKKALDMQKLSYLLCIDFEEEPGNTTKVIIKGVKA